MVNVNMPLINALTLWRWHADLTSGMLKDYIDMVSQHAFHCIHIISCSFLQLLALSYLR
jgi:hypothetical protein